MADVLVLILLLRNCLVIRKMLRRTRLSMIKARPNNAVLNTVPNKCIYKSIVHGKTGRLGVEVLERIFFNFSVNFAIR